MADQLSANFTAAYTSISHGTVLDTDAEGVQIGSLTALVAGTGATLALQGGVLRATPASPVGPSLGDVGAYGAGITRAAGTALLARARNIAVNPNTAGYNGSYVGWWDGQTCNAADRVHAMWLSNTNSDSLLNCRTMDGNGTTIENLGAQKWGTGSVNELCLTLGGCTSGGVPYQGGDASTYTYGCQFLARGGDRIATRLVWVADSQNQATLYPTLTTNSGPCEFADVAVTAADSGNLVQPTSYTASPSAGTTFDCLADALVSWYVTRPSAGTLTLALRYVDDSNYIGVSITSGGVLTLFSRTGGSNTTIGSATAAGTIASGDSRIVVTMDGAELKVYRANASTTYPIASGTSTAWQTQTGGKLIGVGTSGAAAKLAAFPRILTSSPIDTRYGAYSIAGLDNRTEDAARAAIISAVWSGGSLPTDGLGVTRSEAGTDPLSTYSLVPTNKDKCYLYDDCDFGGPTGNGPVSLIAATSLADALATGGAGTTLVSKGGSGAADEHLRECGNLVYDPADATYPYKLYYSAGTSPYTGANIGVALATASSLDGPWTKQGFVIPAATLPSEDAYVVLDGGTYHLWAENKTGANNQYGICYFTSPDGVTWTRQDSNGSPALDKGVSGWDSQDVSSPIVWREGSTWYMLFEGRATGQEGEVGLATASSPAGPWTKSPSNPVLATATAGAWDSKSCVPDDLVKINGTYYLIYHGQNTADDKWGVGLATSTDLVTWTRPSFQPLIGGNRAYTLMILNGSTLYNVDETDGGGSGDIKTFRLWGGSTRTASPQAGQYVARRFAAGSSQSITLAADAASIVHPRAQCAVSGWFKSSDTGTTRLTIYNECDTVAGNNNLFISLNDGAAGRLRVFARDASGNQTLNFQSDASWNDGNWHFFTYNRFSVSSHQLLIDGAEVATNTTNLSGALSAVGAQNIGARQTNAGTAGYFTGDLAEICTWAEPLTIGDHQSLRDGATPWLAKGSTANLRSYWSLSDGSYWDHCHAGLTATLGNSPVTAEGAITKGTTRNRDIYLWTPTSGTANGRLVVFGTGHTADLTALNLGNQGASIKALVEEGYAVAWIMMPGGPGGSTDDHTAYPHPTGSANYLRYFIEPFIRTLNELIADYPDRPCIGGLSGGGWSTILVAAIDPRFRASCPVSGNLWLGYPDASFGVDWEQFLPGMGDLRLDYPDLYRLACTGGRTMAWRGNVVDNNVFTKADYDAAFVQFGPYVEAATGGRWSMAWESPGTAHEIGTEALAAMIAAFGAATPSETRRQRLTRQGLLKARPPAWARRRGRAG